MNISENSTFSTIIGVVSMLFITLLLGSYTYTWSGLDDEQKEKREWRQKHEEALEKKFNEVRQGQEKLADAVNKNNDNTKEILLQILEEQKKTNQLRSTQPRRNP